MEARINLGAAYGWVDFASLRSKLTIERLRRQRTWNEIWMHFVKTLILVALPTIVDLGIDSFSAEKFIVGANYKRWVANLSDIQINNNCVRTSSNSDDGFLEITCFEQDTIWGRITAGLIFILARKENAVIRIWVYFSHGWWHSFSWDPSFLRR